MTKLLIFRNIQQDDGTESQDQARVMFANETKKTDGKY